MARKKSLIEDLIFMPWWISAVMAVFCYVGAKVLPFYLNPSNLSHAVYLGFVGIAPWFGFVLLMVAALSFIRSLLIKTQCDKQTGIDTVRKLDWKQFEELLGEIFRRKGFRVVENHNAGPDGGIDLRLRKDGQVVLVQCKQWRAQKVGVAVVRELYGVMAAEGAPMGMVVTSGRFTQEAESFAKGKRVMLIDGEKLIPMLKEVQSESVSQANKPGATYCPECGKEMVLRTAKKGKNSGQKFWGCSGFPNCRITVPIETV